MKALLHHKHLICFSLVSSLHFSILSSSQILLSGHKMMLVEGNTSEMMDQDEEVALELSNWIESNEWALSLSGVISLSMKRGGDGLQCLYFLWRGIFRRNVRVSFGGACILGGNLSKPVFPAQLPSLPMLVDSQVSALPVSVAAWWGNCHQPRMPLGQMSGQALLLAISSFKDNWKGNSKGGRGHAGHPILT